MYRKRAAAERGRLEEALDTEAAIAMLARIGLAPAPSARAMTQTSSGNALAVLAWANVGLHAVALALAAVVMRPGTPLAPLSERLEYLAGAPGAWALGWASWMLCAVLLVAFLAAVAFRVGEGNRELARLGLTVAVVGAGFDLLCDTVSILVFPMLASWQPPPERLFLTVERVTGIGSLVIANGAYSVAILVLSTALRNQPGVSPLVTGVGYAVGAAGLVLAAAGFTGSPRHAEWATPPTIGLFCVWAVLVARALRPDRGMRSGCCCQP
jgi:hypothetical protein